MFHGTLLAESLWRGRRAPGFTECLCPPGAGRWVLRVKEPPPPLLGGWRACDTSQHQQLRPLGVPSLGDPAGLHRCSRLQERRPRLPSPPQCTPVHVSGRSRRQTRAGLTCRPSLLHLLHHHHHPETLLLVTASAPSPHFVTAFLTITHLLYLPSYKVLRGHRDTLEDLFLMLTELPKCCSRKPPEMT